MVGKSIAHFEITAKIGEGGMGEVYQATDKKLNRQVALKILPQIFAQDPQRMGRFQREAQVLASLNHPNIAAIHGLEEANGTKALVMELVEGEDLSERIARGPIPLEDALPIALQIAEALEDAHEKGIIHRDLKPTNIKLTSAGKVKILDFGLAKALEEERTQEQISNSPTLTMQATQAGIILGTAAYMSPEQARGKPVDRRADIWAFGAVLFEMLSGRQVFAGEDLSLTLAAVMKEEPDWRKLPNGIPVRIRRLVGRCLEKDPRKRLQAIGEARIVLEAGLSSPADEEPESEATLAGALKAKRGLLLAGVILGATLGALGALAVVHLGETPKESNTLRLLIANPEGLSIRRFDLPVISPDGKQIVLSGTDEGGVRQLWVRRMDSLAANKLSGTEGALFPFWSPDSRFIGFFAGGKLKKIATSGGPPMTLAEAAPFSSGTWSRQGIILFDNRGGPIRRVSAAGGEVTTVTTLDSARHETFHRFPRFLPNGVDFVYAASPSAVKLGSLNSAETRVVLNEYSVVAYDPSGYLVFVRGTTLMAQSFDASTLEGTGEPVPVIEGVRYYSISDNGILVYRSASPKNRLLWRNREGRQIGSVGDPGAYIQIALSPDGKRVVADDADGDVWILELATEVLSRFTFDPVGDYDSVWSPDGRHVLFCSARNGRPSLFRKALGSSSAQMLLESTQDAYYPEDWSPDGRFVIFITEDGRAVYALDLQQPERPAKLLYETPFHKDEFHLSPDGRWIAYHSEESGRWEVYMASFPDFAEIRQISNAGGLQPIWRKDGKELFYLQADGMLMSVPIESGSRLEPGTPQILFPTGIAVFQNWNQYDVTEDGQRFLMIEPEESDEINVVVNWVEELKRNVPAG